MKQLFRDHPFAASGFLLIFLTRWLFAPVGPQVNFAAASTRFNHLRFTLWAIAGETVRVVLSVLLGNSFAGNIQAASELAGSTLGILPVSRPCWALAGGS